MPLAERPWLPAPVAERIAAVEAARPADPRAVAARITELVDENHAIHDRDCVNLNPATNVMNPKAEALLAAGLGSRASLGYPGDKYETGLEAIEQNDLASTDDLEHDDRWPKFAAGAVAETPVRSMFGVRILLGGDSRGALNFYATEVNAFSELDRGVGAIFSTLASLALQSAVEQRKSENLLVALESSRQIGMAMGILMASKLLTAEQAFEQLRTASQHLHRRVREVAEEVTETGQLPPLPPKREAG